MIFRNGNYTIISGVQCAIWDTRGDDYHLTVVYEGSVPPDADFFQYHSNPCTYTKLIEYGGLTNAYWISTFALYKGERVRLFHRPEGFASPDIVSIATTSPEIGKRLGLLQMHADWFMNDISIRDIEKVWEEYSPSNLCDKMPEGLSPIVELNISEW